MTELLHRTLGEQIELEGVLAPRLWPVEADQNQLESAILNLAVNARDAMPDGGKLTIETGNTALDESLRRDRRGGDARASTSLIAVSDTGHGMSQETLARVFEPFFTTKEVGTRHRARPQHGLRLREAVRRPRDDLQRAGPGHDGEALLPALSSATPSRREPEASAVVPTGSEGEVILVVEDNEDVRTYSVDDPAGTGLPGPRGRRGRGGAGDPASADQRIDLLFTDVVLPGKSGRVLADVAADAAARASRSCSRPAIPATPSSTTAASTPASS